MIRKEQTNVYAMTSSRQYVNPEVYVNKEERILTGYFFFFHVNKLFTRN